MYKTAEEIFEQGYAAAMEKFSGVKKHLPVIRHLPGKGKKKRPLVGIPGGLAIGGLLGGLLGKHTYERSVPLGVAVGMGLGGALAALNLQKNYGAFGGPGGLIKHLSGKSKKD